VCDAGALVAVGMASSEGPAPFNDRLAQCRADVLAAVLHRQALACPDPDRTRILTLSLGQATATADSPQDRRALVLRLEDGAGLVEERAPELDPVIGAHSGTWRLAELGNAFEPPRVPVTGCSPLSAQ
jgi:hypothetical protein